MRIQIHTAISLVILTSALPGCAPELRNPPEWQEGRVASMSSTPALRLEGTGRRVLSGIAAAPSGGTVLAGHFQGQLDVGSEHAMSKGIEDLLLVRLDEKGTPISLFHAGGAGASARARAVAARADGSMVVAGELTGAFDFEGTQLESAGGCNVFLATLGADGSVSFAKSFGGAGKQTVAGMALDGDGNIVIAGSFEGVLDLGTKPLFESPRELDGFVASFDAAGSRRWARQLRGTLDHEVKAVAASASGVVVVGEFTGTLDAGEKTLRSTGKHDVFVVALDQGGQHRWSLALGDADDDDAAGVVVDSAGNTLVAGSFTTSIGFGGAVAAMGPDERAAFVAVIDEDGELIRVRGFGQTGTTPWARAITAKPGIGALVAVDFVGSIKMGDNAYNSSGKGDILVFDIDTALRVHSAGTFNGTSVQHAIAATIDGNGDTLLLGELPADDGIIKNDILEPFWMKFQ